MLNSEKAQIIKHCLLAKDFTLSTLHCNRSKRSCRNFLKLIWGEYMSNLNVDWMCQIPFLKMVGIELKTVGG